MLMIALSTLTVGACAGGMAPPPTDTATTRQLTLAAAQREIRIGMSGAEVIDALGSPNIVSTDAERREVWVYDRVSTVEHRASRSGGAGSLLVAIGDVASGGLLPHYSARSSTRTNSQQTLTVIIKFDADRRVRDFAYHASRF